MPGKGFAKLEGLQFRFGKGNILERRGGFSDPVIASVALLCFFNIDVVGFADVINQSKNRLLGAVQHPGQVGQRMAFARKKQAHKQTDELFTVAFIGIKFFGHTTSMLSQLKIMRKYNSSDK